MTSDGLVEMFEGDSADRCTVHFFLVSKGGWSEGLACADLGASTPIGTSGICWRVGGDVWRWLMSMSITCAKLARLLFAGTCVHLVYRVVQLDPNQFSWVLQLRQLMFENHTISPRRRLAIESSNWNKNIMIPRRKCLWDQPFPCAFQWPAWASFCYL
jgi:hypothetical protein